MMSPPTFKNPELRAAMRTYVHEGMRILSERILAGDRVPALTEDVWEPREGDRDGFVRQQQHRPLWDMFAWPAIEHLRGLPEYAECVRAIEADAVISIQMGILVGVGGVQRTYSPESVMTQVLLRLVHERGQPTFDEELFEREYAAMEEAFHEDWAPVEILAPLTGFSMEAGRIDLDDGLSIEPIPEEDRVRYAELGEFVADVFASGVPRFTVRSSSRAPKLVGELTPEQQERHGAFLRDVSHFDERLRDLELALGAYKSGRYEMRRRDVRIRSWFPTDLGASYAGMLPEGYRLDEDEAGGLAAFWRETRSSGSERKNRRYLGVAIRRLRYAQTRERLEDRLVDLVIAAEALFPGIVGKPSSAELRYRLSMYVAGFLGSDREERRSIFERMRRAYDRRSSIVHGDAVDEGTVAQLVQDVEQFVREGLRKAIELAAAAPGGGAKLVEEEELAFP